VATVIPGYRENLLEGDLSSKKIANYVLAERRARQVPVHDPEDLSRSLRPLSDRLRAGLFRRTRMLGEYYRIREEPIELGR